MQDNQDKEKVRMKYKTEYKKNPSGGEIFHTRPDWPLGLTQPPTQWEPGHFPGCKAWR